MSTSEEFFLIPKKAKADLDHVAQLIVHIRDLMIAGRGSRSLNFLKEVVKEANDVLEEEQRVLQEAVDSIRRLDECTNLDLIAREPHPGTQWPSAKETEEQVDPNGGALLDEIKIADLCVFIMILGRSKISGIAASAVPGSSVSSTISRISQFPQFPQTQKEVCSINLPVKVLVVVFGKLTPREVARLSVVCRRFSEAAKSDQLWRQWLPPNIGNLAENAYGGPVRYDSLKNLYDRIRTSNHHILLGEGREGCGIEPETGGYCFTYAARTLDICWGDDPRYWQWVPGLHVPGARFPEVAHLETVFWLHLIAEVRVRLPPGTYSLRWVLRFREAGWPEDPITITFADGGTVQLSEIIFPPVQGDWGVGRLGTRLLLFRNNRVHWKENGWIEYEAGVFTVEEFDDPTPEATRELTLKSDMRETVHLKPKSGMFVDGIVIRQVLADREPGRSR
ncbi:hypothetical protein R1sor_000675 [Riccia sorocarpa]|uniref:F-box domain-containing protein n=1 Tax=Riccia sorocarpa TaxID=122646 RepID=A0ABD3GTU3_9MARC